MRRIAARGRDVITLLNFQSTAIVPRTSVTLPRARAAKLTSKIQASKPSTPRSIMSSLSSDRPTKALYQLDERLRSNLAKIRAITPIALLAEDDKTLFKNASDSSFVVETVETIFYAQGGGQPSDTGYITTESSTEGKGVRFEVEAVRHGKGEKILHLITGENIADALHPGDIIQQHVDCKRRDLNSRAHTAGHVVGLAVRRLVEQTPGLDVSELKASHFPDACFVEFKGLIDGKYKEAIQEQSSKFVKAALPIELSWYSPEDLGTHGVITAEGMPIVAGSDGKVRVVDIVGAGAYPCGGTHVPDTSYVGELVIKGIKRQKGISKVSYTIANAS